MYTKKLIILIGLVFLLSVTQAQEKKDAQWEGLNQKTGKNHLEIVTSENPVFQQNLVLRVHQ